MLKNLTIKLLFLLFFFPQCSTTTKYSSYPSQAGSFSSLNAKIFFRNDQFKFSGKILLSYDQEQDKILFLSPMNQVYFKVLVMDEHTVLVNLKKRRYWQGPFHILFSRMGKVNLTYQELKDLILKGITPATDQNYSVSIKKNGEAGPPQQIIIEGQQLLVRIKIRSLKLKKGKIYFKINKNRLVNENLEKTLSINQ